MYAYRDRMVTYVWTSSRATILDINHPGDHPNGRHVEKMRVSVGCDMVALYETSKNKVQNKHNDAGGTINITDY